jgi:hypothetical protein
MTTKFDYQQVIKKVYDEPSNRLRVDAALTMTDVVQEVLIDDTTDSIKIGDGNGDYLNINSDGSLNVNVTEAAKEYILEYNEITSIASFTETTVVSYTVPSSKVFILKSGSICVNADTDVRLKINGTTKGKKQSNWTQRNIEFNQEVSLEAGDIISFTVEHGELNAQAFQGNINGYLFDA